MKKIFIPLLFVIAVAGCRKSETDDPQTTDQTTDQTTNQTDNEIANGGKPLNAVLSGANVVPGPGDADGKGSLSITLNQGQQTISYQLTVSDIATATAATIHSGAKGKNGASKAELKAPTGGSAKATLTNIDKDFIKDLIKNPQDYYITVATADFPGGALRGQLSKQ